MRKIGVYHDGDLDGKACAAVMMKAGITELIPWDYHYNHRDLVDMDFDEMYMCDISLPQPLMDELNQKGKFVWIDHHKSVAHYDYDGLFDTSLSACELTWKYFFDEPMPDVLLLLGKYDTWRKEPCKYTWNDALAFQMGMRIPDGNVIKRIRWMLQPPTTDYTVNTINPVMNNGDMIIRYQEMMDAKACENAFRTLFLGYDTIVCNGLRANSNAFKTAGEAEIYCSYVQIKRHLYRYNLYSTAVDVSEIAKSFGGGGHKGAAGFVIDKLLF